MADDTTAEASSNDTPQTPPPTALARPAPDPQRLLAWVRSESHVHVVADRVEKLLEERGELQKQLGEVNTAIAFEAAKLEAVRNSTEGNPGLRQRLEEQLWDHVLRKMLKEIKVGSVEQMRRKGADDRQILLFIVQGRGSGTHYTDQQRSHWYSDGKNHVKVSIEGRWEFEDLRLVAEVRRVLQIPHPGEVALQLAGGQRLLEGPPKKGGSDGGNGGAATPVVAKRRKLSGAQRRKLKKQLAAEKQDYGEWLGILNGVAGTNNPHLGIPVRPGEGDAFFRRQYDADATPGEALTAARVEYQRDARRPRREQTMLFGDTPEQEARRARAVGAQMMNDSFAGGAGNPIYPVQ